MALSLCLCPAADGADLLATVADGVDAGDECGLAGVRAGQGGGTSTADHPRAGSSGLATSGELVVPEGLHLELLPPYAPELQPAERLWTLTDEAVVNRHFATLEALQAAQAQHCLRLSEQRGRVQAQKQFHWWPTLA